MTLLRLAHDRFDDHLRLASRDFSAVRLVAFHGISGSGKSTAITYLAKAHRDFRSHPRSYITGVKGITGLNIDWRQVRPVTELVIVDECRRIGDALGLIQLLRRGHRVLAASHLPLVFSTILGSVWPVVAFSTDRDSGKIERYLDALGASYSPGQVGAFCSRFGASYRSIDLIMDFDGGRKFDRAYDRFQRCCRIETKPSRSTRTD